MVPDKRVGSESDEQAREGHAIKTAEPSALLILTGEIIMQVNEDISQCASFSTV